MVKYFCDICGKGFANYYELDNLSIESKICSNYDIKMDICKDCKSNLLADINNRIPLSRYYEESTNENEELPKYKVMTNLKNMINT